MKYVFSILLLFILITATHELKIKQQLVVVIEMDSIYNHIKYYEGLHENNKTYVGYGCKILNSKDTCANIDSLLIARLDAHIEFFKDSKLAIPLGMLAYQYGVYAILKSQLYKKVINKAEFDSIYAEWIEFAIFRGDINKRMLRRRLFELNLVKQLLDDSMITIFRVRKNKYFINNEVKDVKELSEEEAKQILETEPKPETVKDYKIVTKQSKMNKDVENNNI